MNTWIAGVINRARNLLLAANMLRLRLWFRMLGMNIQGDLRIYGHVIIKGVPSNIRIGKGCTLNVGVVLGGRDKLTIGDNARISSYVRIQTASLIKDQSPRTHLAKPVRIGDNVWLASGSMVCPGVTIGDNCVVAAHSVVIEDLEAGFVYAGSPARKIGEVQLPAAQDDSRTDG